MEEIEGGMKTKFEGYVKGRKALFGYSGEPRIRYGAGARMQDYQELLDSDDPAPA